MTSINERYFSPETPTVFRSPLEAKQHFPVINTIEDAFFDQLSNTVRYDRYRVDETPDEWIELLGPDVLFLTHPHEAARLTHDFVMTEDAYGRPVGNNLRNGMYVAPWIHDFGELKLEGLGVGDISFDKKTDAEEKVEEQVFSAVIGSFTAPDEARYLGEIYRGIAMDKNSPLGHRFRAIERLGYQDTAIRAYLGHRGRRIENWDGLVGNVLSNNIRDLLSLSRQYPFVDIYMKEHEDVITGAFAELPNEVRRDREGTLSYNTQRLEDARDAWQARDFS